MATHDDNTIFRVTRLTVNSDSQQVKSDLQALGVPVADFNEADYESHVVRVKALTDKLADLFDANDYSSSVALDALENILRSGVGTTMGGAAGNLLDEHLQQFHEQVEMLRRMKSIIDMVVRAKDEGKKTGVEDLLAELSQATQGEKEKS
jgi:hypothetical protein